MGRLIAKYTDMMMWAKSMRLSPPPPSSATTIATYGCRPETRGASRFPRLVGGESVAHRCQVILRALAIDEVCRLFGIKQTAFGGKVVIEPTGQ